MHNCGMYIVAIAWLYVAALAALTDTSVVGGVITFFFYGLFPAGLVLWMSGSKVRRQRLLAQERARQRDGSHTQADQQDL